MPRYVLQPQFNESEPDPGDAVEIEAAGDAAAKASAVALFATFPEFARTASVSIAKGAVGDDPEWLGAYDREGASDPVWSPDD